MEHIDRAGNLDIANIDVNRVDKAQKVDKLQKYRYKNRYKHK